MEEYRTADALQKIIALAQRSNKYIDETTPWALAKDEASLPRLKTVLSNLMEAIRFIGVLLCPFLPDTSASILEQIQAAEQNTLESLDSFGAAPARKVGEAKVLFARIDEAKMMARIQKEIVEPQIAAAKAEEAAREAASAPAAETKEETEGLTQITIDDFGKVALRVGKIVACEKLKKSRKLLKIQLEDGAGTRQILSGISQWYAPEDLIGKKVLFVANLKPAKLAGEMSEGMILAADCSETDVKVMFVDDAIPVGAVVR